jgi:hypothetical protein
MLRYPQDPRASANAVKILTRIIFFASQKNIAHAPTRCKRKWDFGNTPPPSVAAAQRRDKIS